MDPYERAIDAATWRLVLPLRQYEGIDPAAADALKEALRAAAVAWADSPTVSKYVANLFIDLAPAIESCGGLYKEAEAVRIAMLADEIAGLVRACVEVPDAAPTPDD